jgi:hypothetical protein
MNSQSQRSIFNDPAVEAELVTPLSGPSYGPFDKARRRWHKPLPAIIADAIANNQALLTRLATRNVLPRFRRPSSLRRSLQRSMRAYPRATKGT